MINKKRGDGYIQVCVLIIALCMLLSVLVTFAGAVNVVKLMKRNSYTVLETFVTKNSIEIYNSIKQGTNDIESFEAAECISDLSSFCTFEKIGNYYYHKDENRRTEYYISTPTIGFSEDGRLKLIMSYTLYVPIYFDNYRISTARVPITVKLNLDERF